MIKLKNILSELDLDVPEDTGYVPWSKLRVTGIVYDDVEYPEVTLDGRWMEGKDIDNYYQLELEDLTDTGDVLARKGCELWTGVYTADEIPEVKFVIDLCRDYDDDSYYIINEDDILIIFKD